MLHLFTLLAALAAPVSPAPVPHYDVLISAGHEGRPASCAHFRKHHCNLGAPGERAWTPIVADAATRILRSQGFSVAREPADFAGTYDVKAAIFIHFDGIDKPCTSGASIGYHRRSDARAAAQWRALYSRSFPFRFMPDNFTLNLRDYYGFRQVHATDGALVLELGEVTCPAQKKWLAPRLQWEGALIARFVRQLLGRGHTSNSG
jgi:hypothetical protein